MNISQKSQNSLKGNTNSRSDVKPLNTTKSLDKNSEGTNKHSNSHGDSNLIIDTYQQKQIYDFYSSYMEVLDNINVSKPELVKRSFENYMAVVEDNYIDKINDNLCQKIKDIHEKDINSLVPVEYTHPDNDVAKVLGMEFYVFYRVLDMHWKMLDVKKKDILLLSPCKIFLLYSIAKRKYQEELDFK